MNLGGFEITPPVTFRLVSGSGPVHISGQHFVSKYLSIIMQTLITSQKILQSTTSSWNTGLYVL